jgi:hypothetical protein
MKTDEITAAASSWCDLVVERHFFAEGASRSSKAFFSRRITQAYLRYLRSEGIRKYH